ISHGAIHTVPADLRKVLTSDAAARAEWEDITPLARNEWICWVISVKKQETRRQHIERVRTELKEGMRRPCCWPGGPHRCTMTSHSDAETNIWNAICDQAVAAKALVSSLAAKDATLAISPHLTYELARTFTGKRPTRETQGIKLFSCMKAFLDLDMPCSKELM